MTINAIIKLIKQLKQEGISAFKMKTEDGTEIEFAIDLPQTTGELNKQALKELTEDLNDPSLMFAAADNNYKRS